MPQNRLPLLPQPHNTMNNLTNLLGNIVNLRNLFLALALVGMVWFIAYSRAKNKVAKKSKPGQYMEYTAPHKTATQCRALLDIHSPDEIFDYTIESAPQGGWFIHFTTHRPTGQIMDTLYLIQFTSEQPARFFLSFIREAFGSKEPVFPESMLDEFIQNKLEAVKEVTIPTF